MAATFQYSPRPPGMMDSHSSWPRYRNPLDSCSAMPITGPYFKVSVMIGVTIVDSSVSGVRRVCAVPAGGQDAASAVDRKRNAISQCHHINESWYTALDCRIRSSLSLGIKPYLRTSPNCVPGSSLYLSGMKHCQSKLSTVLVNIRVLSIILLAIPLYRNPPRQSLDLHSGVLLS